MLQSPRFDYYNKIIYNQNKKYLWASAKPATTSAPKPIPKNKYGGMKVKVGKLAELSQLLSKILV